MNELKAIGLRLQEATVRMEQIIFLNGSSIDDGVRPWDVSYFLPQNAEVTGGPLAARPVD